MESSAEPLRTGPDGRRLIVHPGPPAAERVQAVPVTLRHRRLHLPAGATLLQALDVDASSAVLRLGAARFEPFAHVLPARSRDGVHAVYFSQRFDAHSAVQMVDACVTFGRHAGQPWLHCHALWHDAAGGADRLQCGHVLPADARLASPLQADAWLIDGAAFEVQPCAETAFSLFQPKADGARPTAAVNALAVRLAPNVDPCTTLEALCRQHGITRAAVRGGVGSTVGAVFDDGRRVEPFVTELLVTDGRVVPDDQGQPSALIDVALIDHSGALHRGRLARRANAVLVTFELVLERLA